MPRSPQGERWPESPLTACLLRRFVCCGVLSVAAFSVPPPHRQVLPSPRAAIRQAIISGPRGQLKPIFPGSYGRVVAGPTARETSYSTAARFRERTLASCRCPLAVIFVDPTLASHNRGSRFRVSAALSVAGVPKQNGRGSWHSYCARFFAL